MYVYVYVHVHVYVPIYMYLCVYKKILAHGLDYMYTGKESTVIHMPYAEAVFLDGTGVGNRSIQSHVPFTQERKTRKKKISNFPLLFLKKKNLLVG